MTTRGIHVTWHRRLLMIAVGASLVGHVAVLGVQALLSWWGGFSPELRRTKLIYDREPVQSTSEWTREESFQPQARLKALERSMTATIPSAIGGDRRAGGGQEHRLAFGTLTPELSSVSGVRDAAGGTWSGAWSDSSVWATAVDLTNIGAVAQGDPVLLSYFGAIREQIQRTANTEVRLSVSEVAAQAGTVYVGFVIRRNGELQSSAVMSERSKASPQLGKIALRIVQASSPFLPFPPSFNESSKAIIVPIEFTLGS